MAAKKRVRKAGKMVSKLHRGKKAAKQKQAKKEKIILPKIDLSKVNYCPECGSDNIYYSKIRDEIICRDCGGIFSRLTPEQMKKFHEVSDVI